MGRIPAPSPGRRAVDLPAAAGPPPARARDRPQSGAPGAAPAGPRPGPPARPESAHRDTGVAANARPGSGAPHRDRREGGRDRDGPGRRGAGPPAPHHRRAGWDREEPRAARGRRAAGRDVGGRVRRPVQPERRLGGWLGPGGRRRARRGRAERSGGGRGSGGRRGESAAGAAPRRGRVGAGAGRRAGSDTARPLSRTRRGDDVAGVVADPRRADRPGRPVAVSGRGRRPGGRSVGAGGAALRRPPARPRARARRRRSRPGPARRGRPPGRRAPAGPGHPGRPRRDPVPAGPSRPARPPARRQRHHPHTGVTAPQPARDAGVERRPVGTRGAGAVPAARRLQHRDRPTGGPRRRARPSSRTDWATSTRACACSFAKGCSRSTGPRRA